jgi:hypothetical protein
MELKAKKVSLNFLLKQMKIIMIRNNKVNLKYSYNVLYEYFNRLFNTYVHSNKSIAFLLLAANFSNLSYQLN